MTSPKPSARRVNGWPGLDQPGTAQEKQVPFGRDGLNAVPDCPANQRLELLFRA